MTTFVNIENLKLKLNDNYVLNNVNLKLNPGDRCLLIGINGSGKTCLLRAMAGMHMITDGKLIIDNKTCFQDQCNGVAFLGETWSKSVAFSGQLIAYHDIKVKNRIKKYSKKI